MKKIAVIGGGIFGSTAAIYAARAGHEVHLFEALDDILQAASGLNQFRLHRGYHYPRSPETMVSSMQAELSFREEYEEAVIADGENLYAIAREGSKVSAEQFLAICDQYGLKYRPYDGTGVVEDDMVALCIEVEESWVDPFKLKQLIKEKLQESGVHVHLSTKVKGEDLGEYDNVIIAAYANANTLLPESHKDLGEQYQFELCEKPVVELPDSFGMKGVVVMDGPFMCVDPVGESGQYVLGNVVHAIHASSVGYEPEIPDTYKPLLNKGIIKDPDPTYFSKFIEEGGRYIPVLKKARHVGSMFTIRAVLPNVDSTDARPTTVRALDDRFIRIFSGKIGNCVQAAKEAVALISEGHQASYEAVTREDQTSRLQ